MNSVKKNSDSKVELQAKEAKVKECSGTGVIYFFEVDGVKKQSPNARIRVEEILSLTAHEPETFDLIQMFCDGTEKHLSPDERVHLDHHGLERFRTQKRLVSISINCKEFKILPGSHKVKDLKRLAGIPLAHTLAEITCNGLKTLPCEGSVNISGGEKFVSFPRDGQAS